MDIRTVGALAALALLAACAEGPPMTTGVQAGGGAGGPVMVTAAPGGYGALKAVGDRVFFDFDRSAIRPDGRLVLDKQAAWLARNPQVSVQIAGNCDERGTEEYNLALGQRRANAARNFLVAKGVPAARIGTISYGKDRPVALGSNEAAWAQNRNAITEVK